MSPINDEEKLEKISNKNLEKIKKTFINDSDDINSKNQVTKLYKSTDLLFPYFYYYYYLFNNPYLFYSAVGHLYTELSSQKMMKLQK